MEIELVSALLDRRQCELSVRLRRWSIVGAVLLHVVAFAGLFVVPALFATKSPPMRFVEVTVLPAAALGPGRTATPAPRQARPEPPKPKPSEPKPEPPKQEAPAEVPRLQEKKPEPKREETSPTETPRPPQPEPRPVGVDREIERPPASTGLIAQSENASLQVDPDFKFGFYLEQMLELIRRNWDRPAVGGEIELVVSFRVLADGTVEDLSIVSSSRLRRFDLAGMSAVERASPMPPLPRGFRKPALNVTLIFE